MIGVLDKDAELVSTYSLAFEYARNCLAGDRVWSGYASSLWGLYTRNFRITSTGAIQGSELLFDERVDFADGERQNRSWRLIDTTSGVDLVTENAKLLMLGRIKNNKFEIRYSLKMMGIWFLYTDIFDVDDRGNVYNSGIIKIFGIPVMRIKAHSSVVSGSV